MREGQGRRRLLRRGADGVEERIRAGGFLRPANGPVRGLLRSGAGSQPPAPPHSPLPFLLPGISEPAQGILQGMRDHPSVIPSRGLFSTLLGPSMLRSLRVAHT